MKSYEKYTFYVCQKYSITPTERDVIGFLCNNPDSDTAKDICEIRSIPKANISIAVEQLILKSYLKRATDIHDRRIIHLTLTNKADVITDDIKKAQALFYNAIFEGIPTKELEQFFETFLNISNNLSNN